MSKSVEADRSIELIYSLRLLIRHPTMTAQGITEHLGMDPTYFWDVGDSGRTYTMWSLETWTEGTRSFFDELGDVLDWFETKPALVNHALTHGGKVTLVMQLPGSMNIGDELTPQAMARAAALGIHLGVEVFPGLRRPQSGRLMGWTPPP